MISLTHISGILFCVLLIKSSLSMANAPLSSSEENIANINYNNILNEIGLPEIREAILETWRHGINPQSYWTSKVESIFNTGTNLERNLRPLANQVFIKLLRDLHSGSVDPQSIGRDIKLIRKTFLTPQQLQTIFLAAGKNPRTLIDLIAPQTSPYTAVKAALEQLLPHCQSGRWTSITPLNQPLRLFSRHNTVREIKNRLSLLGYPIRQIDDYFDGDLLLAINDIQWNMRIQPDGEISPKGKVWNYLNIGCTERVRQLQIDMEKMRWFPQYFEDRYIFVNLAMSYFLLFDRSTEWPRILNFRTVTGRPGRKSPTMRDEIVKIIINPYWVVPPTIFYEDKVKDLMNLNPEQIRDYFASHHYEAWSGDFKQRLDPTTIDWSGIKKGTATPNIFIRQLPHLGNALGALKFDLTNNFAIYLHDTNQRELFDSAMRQLSSGCIRLEKPLDLAEYLLEETPWDRTRIASMMARPREIITKPTEIIVPSNKRIPVYTVYLTSMMNSDKVIRFSEDLYGQNQKIAQKMTSLF